MPSPTWSDSEDRCSRSSSPGRHRAVTRRPDRVVEVAGRPWCRLSRRQEQPDQQRPGQRGRRGAERGQVHGAEERVGGRRPDTGEGAGRPRWQPAPVPRHGAGSASSADPRWARYPADRMEPMTATPSAAPTCRTVLFTPDPVAAFARGTAFMMTLVADRKSTRLNSSHEWISYAGFCVKKKNELLCEVRAAYHGLVRKCPRFSAYLRANVPSNIKAFFLFTPPPPPQFTLFPYTTPFP